MTANLIKNVQEALQYPRLQKMDPNTQQMVNSSSKPEEHLFSQAAIPAVLAGMYKYVQTAEGASAILINKPAEKWMQQIFGSHEKAVIESVSAYAKQSAEDPVSKLEQIATESVKQVLNSLPANAAFKDVQSLFSSQITTILLYLPPALKMGIILNENVLDDQTNKMEGPVSGLMHSMSSFFSKPDTGKDENIY